MAQVYILHSISADRFYIGSCLDINERLIQHNSSFFEKSYTHSFSDWQLYWLLDHLEYEQARLIEQHIKKMKSKIYIQNLKRYPEMSEKLILKYPKVARSSR